MELVPKTISRPVGRLGAAAQNALEVARFGGLETDQEASPYVVAREHRVYRLRHYYPDSRPRGASDSAPPEETDRQRSSPVLLVPPMMLAAEVYDVSPTTSAVTILREHGIDPGMKFLVLNEGGIKFHGTTEELVHSEDPWIKEFLA